MAMDAVPSELLMQTRGGGRSPTHNRTAEREPKLENVPKEESPLKKKLRARKEAARLESIEVMGNSCKKDKIGKPTEVKEKHLDVLKAAAGLHCTESYYTESKKKIEPFMAENIKPKLPADPAGTPHKKGGNKESMLMKQISPYVERSRSKGALESQGTKTRVLELLKPDAAMLTSSHEIPSE
jgi:hypothetical protein